VIEEEATVVRVEGQDIWVETHRRSACGQCSASKGCGTAALENFFSSRRTQLRVLSKIAVSPGDQVMIGLEEAAMLRGSLAVYLVPLILLAAGAMLAQAGFGGHSEWPAVMGGLSGLVGGFLWLRHYAGKIRHDPRFQPVVLRRIGPTLQQRGIFASRLS
jgi:sigma-E factor negative regulatory protein RseC